MANLQKITPFLWFKNGAREAAEYYVSIFPGSRILSKNEFVVSFELFGQKFSTLNGRQQDDFKDSVSFYVNCQDQAEVDKYWDRFLADGGKELMCGWLTDKFGVAWQIIPEALIHYMQHPDRGRAQKAIDAMMQMKKIDVATLEKAFNS